MKRKIDESLDIEESASKKARLPQLSNFLEQEPSDENYLELIHDDLMDSDYVSEDEESLDAEEEFESYIHSTGRIILEEFEDLLDTGSLDEFQLFFSNLSKEISTRIVNYYGEYFLPLVRAIWSNIDSLEKVRFLIDNEAYPDLYDSVGLTPLMAASSINNLEIVKLLLEHGAAESINEGRDEGITALMFACRSGNLEIVTLLLKNGATDSINNIAAYSETSPARTALSYAIGDNHDGAELRIDETSRLELVKLLVNNGANIYDDSKKFSEANRHLAIAVEFQYYKIIEFFLEYLTSNKSDELIKTIEYLLIKATNNKKIGVVNLFLDNIKPNDYVNHQVISLLLKYSNIIASDPSYVSTIFKLIADHYAESTILNLLEKTKNIPIANKITKAYIYNITNKSSKIFSYITKASKTRDFSKLELGPAYQLMGEFLGEKEIERLTTEINNEQKITDTIKSIEQKGLKVIDVPGDGNCFFHALAIFLNNDADAIRQTAVNHIRENQSIFSEFFDEEIESALTRIEESGEWADNILIQAVANAFDIRINILNVEGRTIEIQPYKQDRIEFIREVKVFYTGNHYMAILETNEKDKVYHDFDELDLSDWMIESNLTTNQSNFIRPNCSDPLLDAGASKDAVFRTIMTSLILPY